MTLTLKIKLLYFAEIAISLFLINRFHSFLEKNTLNNSSTCDLENVLDRHLENVLDRQGQLVEFLAHLTSQGELL